jgi:CHASE1-domain containing sensor protein
MSGTKKESHWIPLADLMTVLMVIFLFMSISYMALVERRQKQQNQIFIDNRIDNSLSCRQKKHEIGTTEDKE